MTMGEIFLSSLISVLLDNLSSSDLTKFLGENMDSLLKKWRGKLTMIQAVLSDAETKQNSLSAVKVWLNDLQAVAYDLDDIIDALATEALRRKLMSQADTTTSNVWSLFSNHINSKVGAFVFDYRINNRIEQLTERLEDLVKQRTDLPLNERTRKRPFSNGERLPTTCLVNESFVCGLEEKKEEVIRLVLDDLSTDNGVTVIKIVGMGGIGKTTLAQVVYNDCRVKDCFDLCAWACVSDDFDTCRVTKSIFEQIVYRGCDFNDLNTLQVGLKNKLSTSKFFLVLDDVWFDDWEDLEALCLPFLSGLPGSKILVTTRDESVASILSFGPSIFLKELANEACLSLLAQQSLGVKNFDGYPHLKEIGKKIVKKCNNLPLAMKALGGVLRTKQDLEEWESVLDCHIWEIGDNRNKILPALRVSYNHLPSHLKRCFVYCAIFPRDYEFNRHELVLLWMAEGFLNQSKGKNLELLGNRYFKELLSRSFFQRSGSNSSNFVMHPLINDLACYVAGKICTRLGYDSNNDQQYKVSSNVRHLSFAQSRYEASQKFEDLHQVSGLRTFLPLPVNPPEEYFISYRVFIDMFPKLKVLRTLSLSGYASIIELPNSVGQLKQLRLLNLSRTWLKGLPDSVTSLCNLQTLSLRDCTYLTILPESVHNLINLRHLDISCTYALQKMPSGISSLSNLRTLSRFIVSKGNGLVLGTLGKLLNLEGTLSIEELQNVTNAQEAKDANLNRKVGLRELQFEWGSDFDGARNPHHELRVLDYLQPPEKLECLKIVSYGGLKFSRWIEDTYFPKLERIHLKKCTNCTSLPRVGHLPLLRELYVEGMNRVDTLSSSFYGNSWANLSFPSLEILEFRDMPELRVWACPNVGVSFPHLTKLSISSCPKLHSVPYAHFSSLVHLVLKECGVCVLKSLPHLPSLTHLSLENISSMTSLCDSFDQFPLSLHVLNVQCCNDLKTFLPVRQVMQNLVCLRDIVVKECPQLVSLQEICLLPMLKSLCLESLESLQYLPIKCLPCSLKKLEVKWCKHLEMTQGMVLGDYNESLELLYIWNSMNHDMRKLLRSLHCFASLTELFLTGCDTIRTFPETGLPPPNLKKLTIWNCVNLVWLPRQMETLMRLEYFSLWYCPNLELFPQGAFPPNLKYLGIRHCETLKPLSEWNLQELVHLQRFTIVEGYPDLVSFCRSDEETYLLPSTLTSLCVAELPKLKSLFCGFRNLLSLQHLDIWKCPELEVLPMEEQLDKLRSLHVHECPLFGKRYLANKGQLRVITEIPDVMIEYCRVSGSRASSDEP